MSLSIEAGPENIRPMHELSERKTGEWSMDELRYHQRVMSDLSPWLNAQGTAMLGQVIHEIERREQDR
ncbi:hypothetical protein SAMN02799630_05981 [Paenibacillus sp. UNCCL117]|uniref:hypothetical protein n=1 Tax=unclassified Paenibacillus TaxID=185978 RepID=UPI00088392DB|nr:MULTISPECIES: hypothetical protein [unclassified Paenibacillus]SDE63242.1 hypothetical protein SAMN04488602_13711 [Paenibacillus sp. cl123]SFW70169.1 hypothetical protein SAMN02799630_05981 [Paenibacillus sp. UNCCL117]